MRPHKYYVPEAEAVKTYPDGREVCQGNAAGKREYDARRVELWMRQDGLDAITGEWVDVNVAEFDHQAGRGSNGGHRDDRIVDENGNWMNAMLSHKSNSLKGSTRYHWLNGKYVPVSREVKQREVA
jgi:hypothetical protein